MEQLGEPGRGDDRAGLERSVLCEGRAPRRDDRVQADPQRDVGDGPGRLAPKVRRRGRGDREQCRARGRLPRAHVHGRGLDPVPRVGGRGELRGARPLRRRAGGAGARSRDARRDAPERRRHDDARGARVRSNERDDRDRRDRARRREVHRLSLREGPGWDCAGGAASSRLLDRARDVRLARRSHLHGGDGSLPGRRPFERRARASERGPARAVPGGRLPGHHRADQRRNVRRPRRPRALALAVFHGAPGCVPRRRRGASHDRVPRLLAHQGARSRSALRRGGRAPCARDRRARARDPDRGGLHGGGHPPGARVLRGAPGLVPREPVRVRLVAELRLDRAASLLPVRVVPAAGRLDEPCRQRPVDGGRSLVGRHLRPRRLPNRRGEADSRQRDHEHVVRAPPRVRGVGAQVLHDGRDCDGVEPVHPPRLPGERAELRDHQRVHRSVRARRELRLRRLLRGPVADFHDRQRRNAADRLLDPSEPVGVPEGVRHVAVHRERGHPPLRVPRRHERRKRAREQPMDEHRRRADDDRRVRPSPDGDGLAPHDPGRADDVLRRRVWAVRLVGPEQPRDVARVAQAHLALGERAERARVHAEARYRAEERRRAPAR